MNSYLNYYIILNIMNVKVIDFLDGYVADKQITKKIPKITSISLILLLVFSFPLNLVSLSTENKIQDVFADELPVKINQDRASETWLLPSGEYVTKIGGEAETNFFDNNTNSWIADKVIALSVNSFKVQSGLISTLFDNDVVHYDMNMTNPVSKEKSVLLNKVDKNYVEVPLVFVERTLNIVTEPSFESVSSYIVNDEITVMNVLERYSTSFGDFFIKYTYKDGKELKHTFTLPSSPLNDDQTFAFAHDFELLNYNNNVLKSGIIDVKDALTDEKILSDTEKIDKQISDGVIVDTLDSQKIRVIETETNELVKELSSDEVLTITKTTLEKTDAGNNFTKVTITDSNNNFLLGEIIAETKNAPSWEKFKEVIMDNTQINPHIRFVYGDWIGGFELDPDTYSSNNPTEDGIIIDTGNNNILDGDTLSVSTTTTSHDIGRYVSTDPQDGARFYSEFDITSIPDGSTVTDTVFKWEAGSPTGTPNNCDYVEMNTKPSTATALQKWDDVGDGTVFVSSDTTCNTSGINKSLDLGTSADSDVMAQLISNWFAIGGKSSTEGVLDASWHVVRFNSEEAISTPDPTLEITYTSSTNVTFDVNNFNGTAVTTGSVTQLNATTSRTISLNSTGFAGIFTNLSGNQNATYKDTDNMITNKTINFTPASTIITTLNNYATSCSVTGSSNDLNSKINNTNGHRISAYTTPSCNTSSVLSWNSTFTADGKSGESFTSRLISYIQNFTAYGKTPIHFFVNGTDTPVTLSGNKLTSDAFTVGQGIKTYLLKFYLWLDPKPDIPTGLTTTPTTSSIALSWTAGNSGVTPISGYKIYRSTDGVTYSVLVSDTGSATTTYTDANLSAITYYYKIASINSYGTGSNSTVDSDTVSSGGVSSGGGGSSGGGASELPTSISNALLLNLGSKTITHSLGEKRTYSLELLWDKTKEFSLTINSIKIGQGNFDSLSILPELLPSIGKKIVDGKGEIFLTVDAPGDKCDQIQVTARCVYVKTYTIPVTVSVTDILGVNYPDIPSVLTISITEKFPIGLAIVVILLLAVSYPIAKIISQNSKKQSRKSPEQMQKDHQKALKKSEKMERKQAKHDMNLFKKIKKEF